jgi:putative phosphoribosyl transferase
VVAAEVASALELPLDVIVSRKLGAPGNPELAIGAIAEGGEAWLNREAIELTLTSERYLEREIHRQREAIERYRRRFRRGEELRLPPGATAIVVDDGVATGSTVFAAVEALRRLGAGKIVVAVPVAPPDTAERLAAHADEVVAVLLPPDLHAVGAFYRDFRQVSDEEVECLLAAAEAAGRRGLPRREA